MKNILEKVRNKSKSYSVSRRAVKACPLAFSEIGVKGRVKSVLNYKKPAFWLIIVAIIACVVVAAGFMTDPNKDDEFDVIYAVGNSGTITVNEYIVEYKAKISQGYRQLYGKSLAKDECFKNEALYQEALRQGYKVSKGEISEHIAEIVLMNYGGHEEIFKSYIEWIYGSMDNFKQLHKKQMIVDLYKEDLETSWDGEGNTFDEYFDELTKDLVEKENFEIVVDNIESYIVDENELEKQELIDSINEISFEKDDDPLKKLIESVENIQSIDIITGSVPVDARMKSITEENDIDMLIEMIKNIKVIRKANESEYPLSGGIGHTFFLRLQDDVTIMLYLAGSEILVWNEEAYYVDIGELDSLYSNADLWSQLDYREFFIGEDGLKEMKSSGGKTKVVGRCYTYTGDPFSEIEGDVFTIRLFTDGTFTYNESGLSSHFGLGEWTIEDEELKIIESEGTENERVNFFSLDGDDLLFVEEKSDNFIYIKVPDGQGFIGEALVEKID